MQEGDEEGGAEEKELEGTNVNVEDRGTGRQMRRRWVTMEANASGVKYNSLGTRD